MKGFEFSGHDTESFSGISRGEKVVAGRNVNSAIARIQADRNDARAWTDLESALQEFIAVRIREYAPGGIISHFDHESIYTEIYDMALRMISEDQCKGITEGLRGRIELLCKHEIGRMEEMPKAFMSGITTPEKSPIDAALASEVPLVVREALEALLPKDREVLQHRFGLDDGFELTVAEIAQKLVMSENRVRQRQQRGMDRLRTPIRWQLGEI